MVFVGYLIYFRQKRRIKKETKKLQRKVDKFLAIRSLLFRDLSLARRKLKQNIDGSKSCQKNFRRFEVIMKVMDELRLRDGKDFDASTFNELSTKLIQN